MEPNYEPIYNSITVYLVDEILTALKPLGLGVADLQLIYMMCIKQTLEH